MSIELYPSKVEGYEDKQPAFILTAFDEYCAEVTISTVVSVDSWPEISGAILDGLKLMKLERGA